MSNGDFEITKREILVSISIIAIMLLLGVVIGGKISDRISDSKAKYNTATRIESTELFRYGMDTNIGNAFVYGELEAVDTVTYPEIGGKYLSVTKVKERYTRHTRRVSYKVGKTTHYRTEVYWTWDRVGSESLKSQKVKFCGIGFNYSQFNEQSENYIDTIKESLNIRYKYYGCPILLKGTIFTYLEKGNLGKDGASFYNDRTIAETVKDLTSGVGLIIFWVAWILLTGTLVGVFYYAENRWLE